MGETTAGESIKFLNSDVPDFSAEAAARVGQTTSSSR